MLSLYDIRSKSEIFTNFFIFHLARKHVKLLFQWMNGFPSGFSLPSPSMVSCTESALLLLRQTNLWPAIFVNWPYDSRFLRERGNFFKPNWTAAAVQDVSQPFIHSLGTPWWYPVLKSYKKPILRPGGSRREEGDPTSDLDILSQDFASTLPWNNFRCL